MWRKFVEVLIKEVDYMKVRDRGRPKQIISKIIKRDLYLNSLNINIIYDKLL